MDNKDLALKRIAVMSAIETFAPQYITFLKFQADIFEEAFAMKIGQIPVRSNDPNIYIGPYSLHVQGPGWVLSDQIIKEGYPSPFAKNGIKLTYLREDQKIQADIYLSKGTAEDHIKFSPVAAVRFNRDKTELEYDLVGQLTREEIEAKLTPGLLQRVKNRPPATIFQSMI